jgi:Ca-activated chloride channel homolog
MRHIWIAGGLLPFLLFGGLRRVAGPSDAAAQEMPSYGLRVSVDEVEVSFHASNANGLSVNDLRLSELRLLDNGKPPARIIDFQLLQGLPIHAGILLDTSDSMQAHLSGNRMIAMEYTQQVLRKQTDQAFVMDFGRVSTVLQALTSDRPALAAAMRTAPPLAPNGIRGTAIFDAIFRACLYEFGKVDNAASGNLILLLSDGKDNASNVSLRDAVDMCQRTNTVIYSFRTQAQEAHGSSGPATLTELAVETGGRVFSRHDSAEG